MSRVLVIGDTHCPGMRKDYPRFLKKTYDLWKCNKVVLIGDVVDWASISFHEKNPTLSNAEDEYKKAHKQVQSLYKHFPKAEWVIGNHDCLNLRQANAVGLPDFLLKDYQQLWDVPKWKVHPRFSRLIIDEVIYTHGDAGKGGQFAAVKNSRDNFQSWVQGHHHSEAGVWWTVNQTSRVFGMNVGTGMDHDLMQFEYGKKFNKKPVLGCGVVIDGKYPHFIPMIVK